MKTLRLKEVGPLFKKALADWSCDKVPKLSASLAYYTLVSLAPLLVILVAVLSFFLEDARVQVITQAENVVGPMGREAIMQIMDNTRNKSSGLLPTIISSAILLMGASGVFAELQDSFNTIWGIKAAPNHGWKSYLIKRFLSMAMVLVFAFLLLVSLVISTVISAFSDHITGGIQVITRVVDLALSIGSITLLFSAMFKTLPDLKIEWKDVWLGAFVTAILFTVGKILLGLYFTKSSPASAYGAAGSLVALLIWVYYSAQIVFFGAELTQVTKKRFGKPAKLEEHAVPLSENEIREHGLTPKEVT